MRIALTLDSDVPAEENDYVRALTDAGVRRDELVVMRPGDPIEGEFDGVVIGGGDDVDPVRYGRDVLEGANVEIDHGRDAVDFTVFEEAWRSHVPVLGICRGLQVVNVARGGTLVQDLPLERPSEVAHRVPKKENRRDHPVTVEPGTRLARIAGMSEIDVNSRHHQAIERAADGFAVAATAPDGVIEAIEAKDGRWLVAVQWHPENLTDDAVSQRLFREFVAEVRRRSLK
ncbi:MAG TPA: gamma-glutamyl-gamma-aminobutyrate hydrolase family protein [Thermoanaerobaculia bacterium]